MLRGIRRHARAASHARFVAGADPDRRAGLLARLRSNRDIVQPEVVAVEVDRRLSPEPFDNLDPLNESSRRVLPFHTEGVVLRLSIAETDAETELPLGQDVECRSEFGDANRIVIRQQDERGREAHVADVLGDMCQHGFVEKVLIRVGDVVLPDRNQVEADVSCQLRLRHQLVPDSVHRL